MGKQTIKGKYNNIIGLKVTSITLKEKKSRNWSRVTWMGVCMFGNFLFFFLFVRWSEKTSWKR